MKEKWEQSAFLLPPDMGASVTRTDQQPVCAEGRKLNSCSSGRVPGSSTWSTEPADGGCFPVVSSEAKEIWKARLSFTVKPEMEVLLQSMGAGDLLTVNFTVILA